MVARDKEAVVPRGKGNDKRTSEEQAQAAVDACRCKESSTMTPHQLFRRMMSDLAFWKKAKKG
jgi:hypothetical protein